jgi:peptidoglycan/LPS O-acetylase OafA/YrhL
MEKKPRLIGIDLFKGLAIYAVVILHTDEGIQTPPLVWSWITDFALFAVPFFLAASFYLAINKLYNSPNPYPLRSRLTRLLIPYACWTVFYLLYKFAKYSAAGESSQLLSLFKDPLSLFFFGGAAFHLYFLPLLITGTFLLKLSEFLITRKISFGRLIFMNLICILIYEILLDTGNYPNSLNIAFQPLMTAIFPDGISNPILRWILVEFTYILRCLPYIFTSMLLLHPDARKFFLKLIDKYPISYLAIFLICNAFGSLLLPQAVYEILRGYTALLAAISLSSHLKNYTLIRNLGLCSFGIYLIHLFFVEVLQSFVTRIYPNLYQHINTPILIIFSIVIILVSWFATLMIMRNKVLGRVLFGY